jgi:hypothetical protein
MWLLPLALVGDVASGGSGGSVDGSLLGVDFKKSVLGRKRRVEINQG